MSKNNPGICVEGRIAFANATRTWEEKFNVVRIAAHVMEKHSHAVIDHETWLEHRESGLVIRPMLVEFKPLEPAGVQTVTTIEASLAGKIPPGVFEFQHATGGTTEEAIAIGIDQWVQGDLVTLLDALLDKPAKCMVMELTLSATASAPPRARRIVLGPAAHFRQRAVPPAEDEEHPFCPCCLLTNSYEAFKELIEGDGFYGIRLYAMRDETGAPGADCRVNGQEWEEGKRALRKYVESWPQASFEFRKQYVIVQDAVKREIETGNSE